MKRQMIIDAISKEKENFLSQFEDKKTFDEKVSLYKAIENDIKFNDAVMMFFTFFLSFSFLGSIPSFIVTLNYFDFDNKILTILIILAFLASSYFVPKYLFKMFTNYEYKNRKKNDLINKIFTEEFENKVISPEIHNMLKIFLSEEQYFNLRKGKKEITYKDTQECIDISLEKQMLLQDKQEIFLDHEIIKEYNYVK